MTGAQDDQAAAQSVEGVKSKRKREAQKEKKTQSSGR